MKGAGKPPEPTLRKLLILPVAALFCGWIAYGQSRNGNWPTSGGDAQRSGWSATETFINKDSVKDLRLLWRLRLDTAMGGPSPVLPPVIVNRLISYRGFRELGFVATSADIVYAVDVDLGTVFWTRHLEYSVREPQVTTSTPDCPAGLTAMPTMPVTVGAGGNGGGAAAGRGNPFIGGAASIFALSSDGRLHRLNISTGDDMAQPVSVIPPNARASNLVMVDNVIYTTTTGECNGVPNALWAIDLNGDGPHVRSAPVEKRNAGTAAIGNSGTLYVKTQEMSQVPVVVLEALSGRGFESRTSFKVLYQDSPAAGSTLAVFNYGRRDLVATSCGEGLCLVDSASFGTSDQIRLASDLKPVLDRVLLTPSGEGRGLTGQLATWQDGDGARWILAPVVGAPRPELKKLFATNETPKDGPREGFVAAFKVQDRDGKPMLAPQWISRDVMTPQAPVVVNGVVFALSAGEFKRQRRADGAFEEQSRKGTHATLYALDARTGRELYSSHDLIAAPAAAGGMTVANGRVYFGGLDGTFYAFGIYMEH